MKLFLNHLKFLFSKSRFFLIFIMEINYDNDIQSSAPDYSTNNISLKRKITSDDNKNIKNIKSQCSNCLELSHLFTLSCKHSFCRLCIERWIFEQISFKKTLNDINCLLLNCKIFIHPNYIYEIMRNNESLTNENFEK